MIREIILAMGCFWGPQATFNKLDGVITTEVGYIGGTKQNPNYEQVSTGTTNHAEAVKITYDERKISLNNILDTFFQTHNPTTKDRQGPDVGTQYRSAIFYSTPQEKELALNKIAEYQPFFKDKIVSEILPATTFYKAEEYHQDFLTKNNRSCHINDSAFDKEAYYKSKMSAERFNVMREKGTETPNTGKYTHFNQKGEYICGACGHKLFDSNAKFDSKSGWPSFDQAIPDAIKIKKDYSHFMTREEVLCSKCNSHLGHVFPDGPTDTGERFCINSIALDFKEE